MITYYRNKLTEYLTTEQIRLLVKRIRGQREWQSIYFENRYTEKILRIIIQTYQKAS